MPDPDLRVSVADAIYNSGSFKPVEAVRYRMAEDVLASLVAAKPYVCENCGRLGVLSSFKDDCLPGWTHGLLIPVKAV